MARKSTASLSVVSISPRDARLAAPKSLTTRQRELWLAITAAKPSDWFTVDAQSLLVGYVKSISCYEILSVKVEATESVEGVSLLDLDKLYSMQERQARLMQSFATKLRLTPQSRYTTLSAATASAKASGKRPWDK